MKLEVISVRPETQTCRTPVLFVHGAWHGAWCWEERFIPYFVEQGFEVHAFSFRNHGKSESNGSLRWRRATEYVEDLQQVVAQIGTPPVLIAHSMGGYVVQKYLEKHRVPALALLASVPPAGVLGATVRMAGRHPLAFLKTNLQMRLWPLVASPALTRDAFFSAKMPQAQVDAYFGKVQDESYLTFLDMLALNLPKPQRVPSVPMLVLGGTADKVFTPKEAASTARRYGADLQIVPGIAHDMMLEVGWEGVAARVIGWLKTVPGVC
ncbi:MAG TPA: alpha/beta fold hydrolase [Chloroflexia bacterium]|nr:alpha/beta fold hydrolase [Chloroflexia bacterium]